MNVLLWHIRLGAKSIDRHTPPDTAILHQEMKQGASVLYAGHAKNYTREKLIVAVQLVP